MDFKKVEGHDGLVRDMSSGAIVNRDTTGYQNYIALRNQKLNEKVIKAEKQIIETQKLVIKEVISNAEDLTAKVIQNLTDLKYDKVEGKKAINTASKNILVEK